jgi:hypothetical protein
LRNEAKNTFKINALLGDSLMVEQRTLTPLV